MRNAIVNQKILVSMLTMLLLICGVQGICYGQGVCKVGDVIQPGESCTYPGTNDVFSVDGAGRARFLFFTAGGNLVIRNSNINGQLYTLVTAHNDGGGRRITELGNATAPPPVTQPPVQQGGANQLWWADVWIERSNLNGTARVTLLKDEAPWRIALDVAAGKVYWTELSQNRIRRANLNGTNRETVVTGLGGPVGIVLDVSGGKMYWAENREGRIRRANLDGTSVETLVTGENNPAGIALDMSRRKMYWTELGGDRIRRANLDGTNRETLVTRVDATDIALDVSGGKMYWPNYEPRKIQRANLNGTNVETVVNTTGATHPFAIALDVPRRKMYWTQTDLDFDTRNTDTILRANFDGTNKEILHSGFTFSSGIALAVPVQPAPESNVLKAVGTISRRGRLLRDDTVLPLEPVRVDVAPYFTVIDGLVFSVETSNPKVTEVNVDGSVIVFTPLAAGRTAITVTATHPDTGETATQQFQFVIVDTRTIKTPITQPDTPPAPVVREDVNGDGTVDVQDLVAVAQQYGKTGEIAADVNGDEVVNIDDLILVAAVLDNAPAAPSVRSQTLRGISAVQVKGWLAEAELSGTKSRAYWRGILALEQLLTLLTPVAPKETALLPNYPNPFNPETWIPYDLAKDAFVSLTIYDSRGQVVRTIDVGHQLAGAYESQSEAVYWDGRNAVGEQVASGVYFYTFTAGEFTATRKMLIRK